MKTLRIILIITALALGSIGAVVSVNAKSNAAIASAYVKWNPLDPLTPCLFIGSVDDCTVAVIGQICTVVPLSIGQPRTAYLLGCAVPLRRTF
jgi:hypothetical protein